MRLGSLRDAYDLLNQAEAVQRKINCARKLEDVRLCQPAGSSSHLDLSAAQLGQLEPIRAAILAGLAAELKGLEAQLTALGVEPDALPVKRRKSS